MDAKGLQAFIIYIERQNYSMCFNLMNLIADLRDIQGMAVFNKVCKLLLIEWRLFLEVSQKVEKTTAMLSITSLHIMCELKRKNAFLKF